MLDFYSKEPEQLYVYFMLARYVPETLSVFFMLAKTRLDSLGLTQVNCARFLFYGARTVVCI